MAVPMHPLSCAEAREEVARRAFEALEPHTDATLEAHLAACGDCRVHADSVERTVRLLGMSLLRHDPPAELEERVLKMASTPPDRKARSRRRPVTAGAAFILIAAGLAGLIIAARPGRGDTTVLTGSDRASHAVGTAAIVGRPGPLRLRVQVSGLPQLNEGAAFAVWVTGSGGDWLQLGQFRASSVDNIYTLSGASPDVVQITVERSATVPDSPGIELLTGRW